MTKDELISIAVERKLVRTKTEARSMKVDALRALVEAASASTGYEHVTEDRDAVLARDAEQARAERDLREGREREDPLRVLDDEFRSADTRAQNVIVWPKPRRPETDSAIERIRQLPERNRHERRRKEALLRQALRASA